MMEEPEDLLDEGTKRFLSQDAVVRLDRNRALIHEGKYEEANDPERYRLRKSRIVRNQMQQLESSPAEFEGANLARPSPQALEDRLFERIIGRNNLVDVSYFDRAIRASKTVARIRVQGPNGSEFGTGFLVSRQLLLTNQHVLKTAEDAGQSEAEFDYEVGGHPQIFALHPEILYLSSPMKELDYALVAVNTSSLAGTPLSAFGWNKLSDAKGKAIVGEYLNVIQHPGGMPKQVALRDNLLINILDDYLQYETDTLRGSSGSPVFNDQWETVALHHLSVPKRDRGHILTKRGEYADESTPDSEIDWIGNEGVRISRILGSLEGQHPKTEEGKQLLAEMFSPAARPPESEIGPASPPPAVPLLGSPTVAGGEGVVTIPLTISIEPGVLKLIGGRAALGRRPLAGFDTVRGLASLAPEVMLDPSDYEDRHGYDEDFLGGGEFRVQIPGPGVFSQDVAKLNDGSGTLLRYEHFSVLISRTRRLPILTAANVDGSNLKNLPRKGDKWYFDPRIDKKYQVGNEVYQNNDLDRGHMVRRLDPVWGKRAKVANEDTFHYTNACPQHKNLNQKTWNDLEEYVLGNAGAYELRVCVFTGPVLREDDPVYRGVPLPREFWKIAVIVNDDTQRLSATGYLLSQEQMIEGLEGFVYGQYRTYQVTLGHIGNITGIDFGKLPDYDPLARRDGTPNESLAPSGRRLVRGPTDLVFKS